MSDITCESIESP